MIAVVGGSMNTGKTTTAASLVHGHTRAGFNLNAGKVTGTGSRCDVWHVQDAGARLVVDFLDAGYPSTLLLKASQVEDILESLLSHLNQAGADFIVLEVADGLFQSETAQLISCFQTGCYAPGYNCNDKSTACFCFSGLWPETRATRFAGGR